MTAFKLVRICALTMLVTGPAAFAVNINLVTVGNPGNAADSSGRGSVSSIYQIGKYEIAAGQYCEFLNKTAATDTYGLYNANMWSGTYGCKIQQSGSSGTYRYSVASDWANRPVSDISWGDAARFANWLANGQPTGLQNASTTENGSYYLNGAMSVSALMAVTRKANATWVLPTANEWYKAANYDPNKPGGAGYWKYPTRSDAPPINLPSSSGANNANFYDYYGTGTGGNSIGFPYYRTEVGAFSSSPSAYGTFDQGGNVYEWNETPLSGPSRGMGGGSFADDVYHLTLRAAMSPTTEYSILGFRVAYVPEPTSILLLALGGMGMIGRRR